MFAYTDGARKDLSMAKHLKSQPGHYTSRSAPIHSKGYVVPASKRAQKKNMLSKVLIALGVVLLFVAGGLFGYSQWQYHVQSEVNAKLAEYATVSDNKNQAPQVDWESLKAVNSEVVGWIQIPGTNVNFPVYQSNNNETYLHTTAEGEYSLGGQIFYGL